MRKLIFGGFLLCTTALYAPQAHAMPFVLPFIGGIVTGLGATGIGGAIAGIGGFSAGAFAAGYGVSTSLLGGFLIKTALAVGLQALVAYLRPQPQAPNPNNRLVNARQPISFMEFAYGRVRKGGPVAFWQRKEGKRYYNVMFAARKCHAFVGWFADEKEVTLNGSGFVEQDSFFSKGRSRVQIEGHLGEAASPTLLNTNFTQWTDNHNMDGITNATVVAENTKTDDFSDVYPSGREPIITGLIDAAMVYDPRDPMQDPDDADTWEYSNNAALILADWITSRDGLGRQVDWDEVAIEADAADVIVLDRDANPLRKWQLAGSYSGADPRENIRAAMAVACDAYFYEDIDGKVGFRVGRWIEPTVEINDDDIIRISYGEGQSGTEIINAFSVEYCEPSQGYREAASSPYIIDDPDEAYSEDQLQVFWVPNHNQAVRVSKRLLRAARAKYRISATLKYHGIRLSGERFFTLDHAEMGVNMAFEIDKFSRTDDGLAWSIEAHSVTSDDFDFNAAVEEPPMPTRIDLETDEDVPEPEGVVANAVPFSGSVGILVEWDDPARDSLLNQVRYRDHAGPGEWFVLSVPPGQYYQNIVGLDDGATYDVQVRATTATGQASKWVPNDGGDEDDPTLSVHVVIDTVAPIALVNFTAGSGLENLGHCDMQAVTGSDAHVYAVDIFRLPVGTPLNTGTQSPVQSIVNLSSLATYAIIDGDGTRVNLYNDPTFDNPAAHTLGSGWSVGSGVADHTATALSWIEQSLSLTTGNVLRCTFNIKTFTAAGSFVIGTNGGTAVVGSAYTSTGIKYTSRTVAAGNTSIGVRGSAACAGTIDDVAFYIQSGACVAQGDYDYYAVPRNRSHIYGPASGPLTRTII